jgi:cobalt-zinc-cadmium efflux system membrane fusion protein
MMTCGVVALLGGCGEVFSVGEPGAADAHGHAHDDHAVDTDFDMDNVPSLNLPPEQREPGRLWCREHSRYEDECYLCHPELMPEPGQTHEALSVPEPHGQDVHDHAHEDADDHGGHGMRDGVMWCGEHDVAEAECGICQPQLLDGLETGMGLKVRLPSARSLEQAGVRTGAAQQGGTAARAPILGELSYNRNQLAVVTPLGAGVVTEVLTDVGDVVEAGKVLVTLNSPAIAESKIAYLKAMAAADLARQTHAREQDLHGRGISARQDLEQARAVLIDTTSEVEHARHHLMNLGLTEAEVDAVRETRSASSQLQVRAPFKGTIIERLAVPGTAVETGMPLVRMADLSTLWMRINVPESLLATLKLDAITETRFDAYPEQVFIGKLTWIAPGVDTKTRMIEARVVVPNLNGLLKDGMFGRAVVQSGEAPPGITVPKSAIQEIDGRNVVFAQLEDDLFETRLVELGPARNGDVTVLAGLEAGAVIALEGSYILKSEFLKARLGAGCADH